MEEDRKLDELINRRQQEASQANATAAAPVAREPDAALDTLPDVPMGRFTPAQVEEWLLAVAASLYAQTENGNAAADANGAESAEKTLALQMVRMIKFLVAKKVRESTAAAQAATGNGTAAVAQKLKEKKQAEIAELSKGLFGSTMAGRKRLFSATAATSSSSASAAASQVAKKPSTGSTPSAAAVTEAKPSTSVEEKSMAGQALLTLSLYDVTRMIRQLQQQIAQQAEGGGKMDIDGDGDEEEDDDEAQSLVSASVTSKPLARAVVPPEVVTELLGASASDTIFWWKEDVMTRFETHFRLAINRRARMDTQRKESERMKRQEAHRLFVEQQPSSLMETVLQKKAAQSTTVATTVPAEAPPTAAAAPASNEAVDASFDDLEALVGGPIAVVRAAEVQAPAPVAVKKEPAPSTVKAATETTSTNPNPPVNRPKKFVVK